jgi:dTDP-D-glucose 4,6-dehydratase
MLKPIPNLPFDMLNLILEYYGRIKYIHKERIFVNIISKNDYRYNILETKINSKMNIINHFNIGNNGLKYYIDVYYKNDIIVKGLIFSKKIL